jgi:GNAT superfamily N-acetyltransferase
MNIRPATREDAEFLKTMLFEAARWNPDWPFEPMETVLAEPMLVRYHEDWGRPGDGGAVAELDGVPVGACWYRVFTADEPGYGFVDEETPELAIAVVPSRRGRGIGEALLDALCERTGVLLFIPVINIFSLPVGVIGATMLTLPTLSAWYAMI